MQMTLAVLEVYGQVVPQGPWRKWRWWSRSPLAGQTADTIIMKLTHTKTKDK